jgi:uncharacterized protein
LHRAVPARLDGVGAPRHLPVDRRAATTRREKVPVARRTFPDPDRADSYFELLDDPVRTAPIDRVALAESELRRLGLDDARVRADGDTATVMLPGAAVATSSGSVLEGEIARAVRSAGFGAATVVRAGESGPDPRPGSGDGGDHDDGHDGHDSHDSHDTHDSHRDDSHRDDGGRDDSHRDDGGHDDGA